MLVTGRAAVVVVFGLLGLVAAAGPAMAATELSCGQQITAAGVYTLTRDLTCTEEITIWSGDVVVDLRGNTLSYGGRQAIQIWATSSTPSHPVMVQNGTIQPATPYAAGDYIYGKSAIFVVAGNATLQRLIIIHSAIGVELSGGSTRIQNNLIESNGWGVLGAPGSALELWNNTIVRNSVGVIATKTRGGYIQNNLVAFNSGTGVSVNNAVPVIANQLAHNGGSGLILTSSEGLDGAKFQVAVNNVAIGNGEYGIWSEFPIGHSGGNRAAGNGSTPQCWNIVCSL